MWLASASRGEHFDRGDHGRTGRHERPHTIRGAQGFATS
jgi:hypothetical protein